MRIDDALRHLEVELCPRGFRLEQLVAPSAGAQRLLAGGKLITPTGDYPCPAESLELPSLGRDQCLRYGVELAERAADPTSLRRVARDLLASPDLWLWVPSPLPEGVQIRARLQLPEGVHALLPWAPSGDEWLIPESAFRWKAAGAFSHSPSRQLAIDGVDLRLAALDAESFENAKAVEDWLMQGARTSRLLFGAFPVPRALVIAVPRDHSGPAFGMALRGGGPAVVILLDRHASAKDLATDWTATHEFLHLGVPRLPPEDAWLFEGLATYYTEVLRARAGIITPEEAYQHLLEGFERGRKNGSPRSLREESAQMRERQTFYRVYWAGAALAFLTDVEARRARGPSLDDALRAFAACCASSEADWSASQVLAHLDRTLGARRYQKFADVWLTRADFPELDATFRELGVSLGAHGRAIFSAAPQASLRDAIMAH
ncbi:MAG TPA: hypothetical protein VGC79_20460 [Polyangiaceae bacterium]